jgi:hypothetical protein
MFRRLPHVGAVVLGLALAACWGCSDRPEKKSQKPEKPAPAVGKEKPGAKPVKPPEGKPEAKEKPTPPGKQPAVDKPVPGKEKPVEPAPADAGESKGRGGRAVGKVFKRLMEGSDRRESFEKLPFKEETSPPPKTDEGD